LGKYKLVQEWKANSNNWELYDLQVDRSETQNIIDQFPNKANEMIAMYEEWAVKVNVLPWKEVLEIRAKKD
jgi:arylsulfatase